MTAGVALLICFGVVGGGVILWSVGLVLIENDRDIWRFLKRLFDFNGAISGWEIRRNARRERAALEAGAKRAVQLMLDEAVRIRRP